MAKREISELKSLRDRISPELYSQVESQLVDPGSLVSDNQNQNQNQGAAEEFAQLKPDVLRAITIGSTPGEEVMDNQNQNQGKVADLVKLKPSVLREMRINLRGGEELMDNQNQNQGAEEAVLKPPLPVQTAKEVSR